MRKHGLKMYSRNPSSYTPLRESAWQKNGARSLTLGLDELRNERQIAMFSQKDSQAYRHYEEKVKRLVTAIEPILDLSVADTMTFLRAESVWGKINALLRSPCLRKAATSVSLLGADIPALYEFLTAPASSILNHWFESEPLKATLSTDAVIGTMTGPYTPGSGYVLLHHMMGGTGWSYPKGGMGAVTQAMAAAAASYGAHIFTNVEVSRICLNGDGQAAGVVTSEGREIKATIVMSNATPYVTFQKLLPQAALPEKFQAAIESINYASPITKINVAVNKLPNFLADPCEKENEPMPLHQCTIHVNCENTEIINQSYNCALNGDISDRPMIEMVIPSSVDPTLAPPGCHVCLLFTQYTPYHLRNGATWDDKTKENYAKQVFSNIEEYAPGFTDSIIGMEVLTPPDLDEIFGLTGGDIFHGALSMDQLFLSRPVSGDIGPPAPFTPINKLLLCGSGAHPGGGVTGAPGYIAAQAGIALLLAMKSKIWH
ncbi:Pyridine nucleotide-disulfide oxidoreductase domain-containing protein 2 [Cryptotermes secundus]|uniref:Pyridine nucleotide-disulfide oxidoreductase domain-containing protein 2 n=1 Tax=Cryptotermes secundus TaxID=105785 RepID=A0A2J7QXA3_9NEOP|nr:pyridine nucleotide-disulfide oxidoreductase domain-containing protein 2 isoform X3 [Cryptotermes secundus]PNF33209.1 Pyridine nucleotide-disulfide oxidoreductase domain-containing protein 2 [Cryptotermes secundus]